MAGRRRFIAAQVGDLLLAIGPAQPAYELAAHVSASMRKQQFQHLWLCIPPQLAVVKIQPYCYWCTFAETNRSCSPDAVHL